MLLPSDHAFYHRHYHKPVDVALARRRTPLSEGELALVDRVRRLAITFAASTDDLIQALELVACYIDVVAESASGGEIALSTEFLLIVRTLEDIRNGLRFVTDLPDPMRNPRWYTKRYLQVPPEGDKDSPEDPHQSALDDWHQGP